MDMNKRSRLFVTVFFSTPVTFQDVKEQYFVKSGRRNAPVSSFGGRSSHRLLTLVGLWAVDYSMPMS